MPWALAGAAVSAAGGIAGSMIQAGAAKDAASKQEAAQQRSLDWIQHVYNQSQNNFQPYIGAGQSALSSIMGFYGLPGGNSGGPQAAFDQFQQTPFYQFPLQQANLATNRSLAASGLIGSGAQLRDISQLNSGYASQGFGNFLGGLTGIANQGQGAAAQLGGIGVNTGPQINAANTAYGNAGAAGAIGQGNAINSGISSVSGALSNPNTLAALQSTFGGSSYGGGGAGMASIAQGGGTLGGNY